MTTTTETTEESAKQPEEAGPASPEAEAMIQPTERYGIAGYPYGKTSRGKKRWLREEKQKEK
jgi:hypothetical protein